MDVYGAVSDFRTEPAVVCAQKQWGDRRVRRGNQSEAGNYGLPFQWNLITEQADATDQTLATQRQRIRMQTLPARRGVGK